VTLPLRSLIPTLWAAEFASRVLRAPSFERTGSTVWWVELKVMPRVMSYFRAEPGREAVRRRP